MTRILLVSALGLLLGCSDDDGHGHEETDAGPSKCEEIASVCHVSNTDPEITQCHNDGHVGDAQVCEARYEECITMCEALDAGPGH